MTVSITLPDELEQFLREQAVVAGVPVETLLRRTVEERWGTASRNREAATRESELLLKIQSAFSPEQTLEYQQLCQRSDDRTLTEPERARLLMLLEERDLQNAVRLEALGELARLRGVSLRALMAGLGIGPE